MAQQPPTPTQELPGFIVGAVTTRLTVTVPPGIVGGELVRVAAPDGSYHSIMVPAGLSAGQQFSVELLAGSNAVDLAKLRVRRDLWPHLQSLPSPTARLTLVASSVCRWSWMRSVSCGEKHSRRLCAVERCGIPVTPLLSRGAPIRDRGWF